MSKTIAWDASNPEWVADQARLAAMREVPAPAPLPIPWDNLNWKPRNPEHYARFGYDAPRDAS